MIRTTLAALAVSTLVIPAATLPSAAYATQVEIEAEGPVIELSIYESIAADPDLVTIGAGVTTEARSAVEAMRLNSIEMRKVIDQIKALGVDEKDIQTTGINLNPRYDYDRDTQRNVFRAYQVSNRVSLRLRDIDATGAALDALVAAGATDLNGPSFSIEDDTAAKALARERAVERAQERAEAYAALYGYDEVRVLSISETIQARSSGPMVLRSVAEVADVAAAPPPVQPGQVSTGVSITIKYEMVEEEEAEE
ncbi:MAG: SIMPL domain-containing protein [Pseudomonadota bacterium]